MREEGKRMERQYSLLSNLAFVLRQMKRFARRSFRMIWLSIPLKAAGNLILFGSGVFGFAVYLSVLRVLPVWLLLLMTACTIVSFSFSGLGDKEHRKVDGARSTSIRKMSYLQDSSADPKFGKDIRLYAMYPWIEEQFAILHRQVRSSYGRVEAKNFLSASITAGMGILIRQYSYEEYCRLFAVVFQDFQIYAASLGENVKMGLVDSGDEAAVREALKTAGIAGNFYGLSVPLLREYDKNGRLVSGGEAQKIAMARAFLKDPHIYPGRAVQCAGSHLRIQPQPDAV